MTVARTRPDPLTAQRHQARAAQPHQDRPALPQHFRRGEPARRFVLPIPRQ
jgi:hypothetical protein